ncbi:MAG: ABC transporter substrate-binding protein [Chloroflexi bacterium]|nr:ABC transporter substrate-binding protein [Chloroflexota bacterium]
MQATEHEQSLLTRGISRRSALRLIVSGGSMAILAACSGAPTVPPASAPTSAPGATTAPAAAAAPQPTTASAAAAVAQPTTASASGTTAPGQAAAGAQGTTATSGTLNVTLADLATENLDTILAAPNLNVVPLIYESLLQYDENGNLIPWLAESWDMSPDGLLWTFNIRKGVKFTNGDDLTADDVKFSIERYASDASTSAWSPMHRQTVDQVEATDPYTVKVHSKSPPYLFYPDAIAGTWIQGKKYFDQVGLDTFSKQPVGTGPWKLTKFTPGVSAELATNADYWGPSDNKPVWDSLVLTNTPEESTRIAMLKRGEADIAAVSWDNAVSLRDGGYQLRQTRASTLPALFLIGYWMQPGPTSDQGVREAMDIAINRQELCDSFFKGFAKPGAGNFALTDLHYGFDPIWYSTPYDPDRAKQLLQAAGYPNKFSDPTINIFTVSQVGWEPDFLQVIAGYWQAVGMQTQLVPMDFTAMRNGWVAPDPKMMGGIATWIGIGGGAAGNSMPAQQNNMTSQGVNQAAHDPDLDKMFFDMIAELDASKRLDDWHQVQQKAFSLHSIEGICRVFDQYAVSDKVGDWTGLDYLANSFIMGLSGIQHR